MDSYGEMKCPFHTMFREELLLERDAKVDDLISLVKKKRRVYISSPTNTGKTMLATLLFGKMRSKCIIVRLGYYGYKLDYDMDSFIEFFEYEKYPENDRKFQEVWNDPETILVLDGVQNIYKCKVLVV